MDAIPLCDIIKAYTDIYVNTQQFLFDTTLFCSWRHVLSARTAIFRPAYNRTGPFYVRTIWDTILCAHKKSCSVSWPEDGCMSSRNMSPCAK